MIHLHNMDCMKAMAQMPDNAFELAICDPPYGINVKTRIFNDGKSWDKIRPSKKYFDQLFRVSSNQIIWGANYFFDYLKNTPCYIVWDKKMTDKHLMSMSEIAWTSFKTKNLIFRQPPPGNRGFYDIDGKRIHPTQKSIDLYTFLISKFAKKGWRILDTHLGSGSSAIAAYNAGYEFHGYEIDTDYYNAAKKRLENHKRQLRMFV
jgi:site-specific DNA-methyltransferase (adenine-specific)